jgi:hypothetical protein
MLGELIHPSFPPPLHPMPFLPPFLPLLSTPFGGDQVIDSSVNQDLVMVWRLSSDGLAELVDPGDERRELNRLR